jgi:glyoxylase-like metal-dependent hydrolase (beta-lactamase superfamily II)
MSLPDTVALEVVGMLDVNCWMVFVEASSSLYIIDPGDEADRIIARARGFAAQNTYILLTHAHVDHIRAAGETAEALKVKSVWLDANDVPLYNSPDNHLMPYVPRAENLPETTAAAPSLDFEIIHTPGHTRGGSCFYFRDIRTVFTGDTLFRGSVGRTDFPGGDTETLLSSICGKLLALPPDLLVLPGHGPETTIGYERERNPFLKGL